MTGRWNDVLNCVDVEEKHGLRREEKHRVGRKGKELLASRQRDSASVSESL